MQSAPGKQGRSIQQLAVAKWRASALDEGHARKLRFRALSAAQVRAKNAKFHEAGALLIPYWTLDGKPTKFFRIRYLEKLPGAAGVVEKPQRYDQLPVLQEAYFPPLLDQTWRKVAKDPSIPVAVTEGELKAACASAQGLPMMALGGVYSFMSGKRAVDLLPSLKEFNWKDRTTYIVYDNDLVNNPDVLRAQHLLSQRLLAEGAKINYISIPPGPEKGVDDYVVKHGWEAFSALLDKAEPFLEGEALWKLNGEVVYIKGVDAVIERETHMVIDTDRFVRHVYANRHYFEQIEKGSGKNKHVVLEKASLAKRWVEWEQRAELQELCYEPGQPRVVSDRAWNMWDGWGVEPKRGQISQWHWLMEFLFGDDDKARKYFEQWCAYPIIHPGAKLFTAVVLWSRVKRLGKSMAFLALAKIYGKNAGFVQSKQLKRDFNTWARNKQLVVGEEITVGKDQVDADYLKYIITHPEFTIHAKFKDEYQITNHTNFGLLSNHSDAVLLEDGDKRFFIHGINRDKPAEREKYEWCDKWLKGPGPAALRYYLMNNVNMRGFNPREHAPDTRSKWEMVQVGKTSTSLWVQKLWENPVEALKPLGQKIAEGCDLFSSGQLYRAFDPQEKHVGRHGGEVSLGRWLHNAGFRPANQGIPLGTNTGTHRIYAVRNQVKWEQAPRRELRAHYEEFWSPKTAGGVK